MSKLIAYFFNTKNPSLTKIWLPLWTFLYLLILSFSILLPYSITLNLIKLISISGCLVYSFLIYHRDIFPQATMFLTLIADILLAFSGDPYFGILCFLVVQSLHHIRLTHRKFTLFLVFPTLIVTLFLKFLFHQAFLALVVLCAVYLILFVLNIRFSLRWSKTAPQNPNAHCAAFGFPLFLACDTCVAADFLARTVLNSSLPGLIFGTLAWVFYYPSQILISNSSKYDTIE